MNVFCIHTTYHLLLSLMIYDNEKMSKAGTLFIVIKDWNISNKTINELRKISHVIELDGTYTINKSNKFSIYYSRIKNLKKIKQIEGSFNNCYIFSDINAETQLVAYKTKSSGGIVNYIEDGLAIYVDKPKRYEKGIKYMFKRSIYGRFFSKTFFTGGYKYNNKCYCLYPSYVNERIMNKYKENIYRIEPRISLIKKIFKEQYSYLRNLFKEKKNIIILFLPLKKLGNYNYEKLIERCINSYEKSNYNIFVKKHPKDRDNSYILVNENYELINKDVIGEMIPIVLSSLTERKKITILGDTSTTLITSRFFLKNKAKIISFIKITNYNVYNNFERIFRVLNINCID